MLRQEQPTCVKGIWREPGAPVSAVATTGVAREVQCKTTRARRRMTRQVAYLACRWAAIDDPSRTARVARPRGRLVRASSATLPPRVLSIPFADLNRPFADDRIHEAKRLTNADPCRCPSRRRLR